DVPGLKTGAFTRKPRVAWFDIGGNSVNSTELKNVEDIWTPIIEGADEFTAATDIDQAVIDHDIIFVFDQGNPDTATAIANVWNLPDQTTNSTPLEHFLNAGGVVIVLDGVNNAGSDFSQTFLVFSGGRRPVIQFGTIQSQNGPGEHEGYDPSFAEQ